jgi:hypothetical protein
MSEEHADALPEETAFFVPGTVAERFPSVARLEYGHGDHHVVLEVPPQDVSELTKLWLELVREMAMVR